MGGRGRLSGRFELFAGAYGFTSYVSTFDLQYLVPAALSRLARLSLYVHLDLFLKRKKKRASMLHFRRSCSPLLYTGIEGNKHENGKDMDCETKDGRRGQSETSYRVRRRGR